MKLLDTSCLSLFILEIPKYGFLHELYELNESLNITQYVKEEFEKKDKLNLLDEYLINDMISTETVNYDPLLKYPFLGDGELSIIQWGLNLDGNTKYCCILDDLNARNVAKTLKLSFSGSIGLIIKLKNKNNYSLKKIDEIINDIDKSTFRIDRNILNKIKSD